MGLDISVKVKNKIVCPKCGDVVGYDTFKEFEFGGGELRDLVRKVGYKDNDYGQYIMLNEDGLKALANDTVITDRYGGQELADTAAAALYDGRYAIFLEADW